MTKSGIFLNSNLWNLFFWDFLKIVLLSGLFNKSKHNNYLIMLLYYWDDHMVSNAVYGWRYSFWILWLRLPEQWNLHHKQRGLSKLGNVPWIFLIFAKTMVLSTLASFLGPAMVYTKPISLGWATLCMYKNIYNPFLKEKKNLCSLFSQTTRGSPGVLYKHESLS